MTFLLGEVIFLSSEMTYFPGDVTFIPSEVTLLSRKGKIRVYEETFLPGEVMFLQNAYLPCVVTFLVETRQWSAVFL